jgi:hypothetical protein
MAAPGLKIKKRFGRAANLSHSQSSESLGSAPSFPPAFDSHHRAFSISSLKDRTWRSFGSKERDETPDRGQAFLTHSRKLSKPRPTSSSSHRDPPSRRGSSTISSFDALSVATALSSCSSVDWEAQHVEGSAPLESDTLLLKAKSPYLVVTTNYLVKTKSRADALALLPGLAAAGDSSQQGPRSSAAEPLLVVPIDTIVSVFPAEGARPSLGFEVWWRNPLAGHALCRSDFFFAHPTERNEQMHHVTRAMRASHHGEHGDPAHHSQQVRSLLDAIHAGEEPAFHHRRPDIFPVVPRGNTRKEYMSKLEEATKKYQEGPAFYLVVGTYLCHLVEIQKGKGGDPVCRHKTYGLTTLESFHGEWTVHDERFSITFR